MENGLSHHPQTGFGNDWIKDAIPLLQDCDKDKQEKVYEGLLSMWRDYGNAINTFCGFRNGWERVRRKTSMMGSPLLRDSGKRLTTNPNPRRRFMKDYFQKRRACQIF